MQQLFLFLYRYRSFLLFILLEIFSAWMIIINNQYQSAAYFNSSNSFVARTLEFSNQVNYFFNLRRTNLELMDENSRLKRQLGKMIDAKGYEKSNSANFYFSRYQFEAARVLNNSTQRSNNYLTINKGKSAGVEAGMGVVTGKGIVGRVRSASENFATVISFLHSNYLVSSKIARTGTFGSLKWSGNDPSIAELKYIPRHVNLYKGDTIMTSGYNSVYPENIQLGVIEDFEVTGEQAFYDVKVRLQTDFSSLTYVYVIKDKLVDELDSLQENSYRDE